MGNDIFCIRQNIQQVRLAEFAHKGATDGRSVHLKRFFLQYSERTENKAQHSHTRRSSRDSARKIEYASLGARSMRSATGAIHHSSTGKILLTPAAFPARKIGLGWSDSTHPRVPARNSLHCAKHGVTGLVTREINFAKRIRSAFPRCHSGEESMPLTPSESAAA